MLTQPPTVVCKMEVQLEYVPYTLHTRFCTFGTDLHAQSMLINEIYVSELSRKFIKSALLVGHASSAPMLQGLTFRPFLCLHQGWRSTRRGKRHSKTSIRGGMDLEGVGERRLASV